MVQLEQIKKRLAETIRESGMSQTALAKRLGVSQSCIAHYLRGDIVPALDTLANLCVICGVSPEYVLCYKDE